MKRLPKKPPIEDDASKLPCDIIEDILSRLPVKSLFRFKSVSKSWNSTISGTEFAKMHLRKSKNSVSQNFFILNPQYTWPKVCLLRFTNQNFERETIPEFPLKKYHGASFICSCDGLVLLKNYSRDDKTYVLWHLSSRTYTKFSCPYSIELPMTAHGLCYDPSIDDYKVVFVTINFYAVYSYKNNSWRKELSTMFVHKQIDADSGLNVNGALHWVVIEKKTFNSDARTALDLELSSKRCTGCHRTHYLNCSMYMCSYEYTHQIYYFDSTDDTFKKFSRPESLEENAVISLSSLRGHLCLYRNTYDLTMVEIWMMKRYGDHSSWMKLVTVENVPIGLHICHKVKPLHFTDNGELVLDINCSGYVVYSLMEKRFGEIYSYNGKVNPIPGANITSSSPLFCLDTLFSPGRNNRPKRKRNAHPKAVKGMKACH